jgi:hypothetical protein
VDLLEALAEVKEAPNPGDRQERVLGRTAVPN